MKKDNRTRAERVAAQKRAYKRFLRASKTSKTKWVRKDSIARKKEAEERAYFQHIARLKNELGIQ
jgi:hypothetical protein